MVLDRGDDIGERALDGQIELPISAIPNYA